MEHCNISLLVTKTQQLLHDGQVDKAPIKPVTAEAEVQILRGDNGRLYKLSVRIEAIVDDVIQPAYIFRSKN